MSSGDGVVSGSIAVSKTDLVRTVIEASSVIRIRWVCVALLAALLAPFYALQPHMTPIEWLLAAIYVGAPVGYLFLGPFFFGNKSFRSVVNAGDNRVSFRFDSEEVTIDALGATTTTPYRVLSRFRECKTTFILGTSAVPGAIA